MSSAGDVNGDGFDDIIIGAYFANPNGSVYAGESYVVFGSGVGFAASLDLSTLNGTNGFVINGVDASDYSGRSVSSAGDVNGDGFDDIIIGAYTADPNGNSPSGETYLIYGSADLGRSTISLIGGDDVYTITGDGEVVNAGSGADKIYGGTNSDTINGGDGNDVMAGGAGNVSLNGEEGNDRLFGQNGDNTLNGGTGNDQLWSGTGADTMIGGDGIDSVYYLLAGAGVAFDVMTGGTGGEAAGDTYSGIERFYGSNFGDNMTGDSDANIFLGLDGNDVMKGEGGSDTLSGGAGNDLVVAGSGDDTLYGDAGNDRLFAQSGTNTLYSGANDDIIHGYGGNDTLYGDAGDNNLYGDSGDDILYGGAGNDSLWGGTGADSFDGGDGIDRVVYTNASSGVVAGLLKNYSDGAAAGDGYRNIENLYGSAFDDVLAGDLGDNLLVGLGGADQLVGYAGNDRLIGGAGDDTLQGGAGDDTLIGQGGADLFYYDSQTGGAFGADKIIGWEDGIDTIEFGSETTIFSILDLTITQIGANTLIQGNGITGSILVMGATATDFTADDFIFYTPPLAETPDEKSTSVEMQDDMGETKQDVAFASLDEVETVETLLQPTDGIDTYAVFDTGNDLGYFDFG